jgi:hypothetical protein
MSERILDLVGTLEGTTAIQLPLVQPSGRLS